MLKLNNLTSVVKGGKRVGRGGKRGGTSGRGHKGQRARSGGGVRPLFEGGQMPLFRRLPKRGFNNKRFEVVYEVINIGDLDAAYAAGATVDRTSLIEKGLVRGTRGARIKILGGGKLSKQLSVEADAFSVSAIAAIEQHQGRAQRVEKEI